MSKPKRLFRFFPSDAHDLFKEQKLWFSAANYFNDLFDVVPRFDRLIADEVERADKREFAFLPPDGPDWPTYKKGMAPVAKQLIEDAA